VYAHTLSMTLPKHTELGVRRIVLWLPPHIRAD
jgi:hypothetical protein